MTLLTAYCTVKHFLLEVIVGQDQSIIRDSTAGLNSHNLCSERAYEIGALPMKWSGVKRDPFSGGYLNFMSTCDLRAEKVYKWLYERIQWRGFWEKGFHHIFEIFFNKDLLQHLSKY